MKKKIVLSSVVAIVICISLLAGATYALFTSKAEVNIAATAGKVNVVATIQELKVYSMDLIQESGAFQNGGTAVLDGGKLTLDRVTPGDKVTFEIKIVNNSNVAIKYNTRLSVAKDEGLFAGLVVKTGEAGKEFTLTEQSPWATLQPGEDPAIIPVSVELPKDAGDEYQETKTAINFAVEAVQANAILDDLIEAEGVPTIYTAYDLIKFASSDLSDVTEVALGADIDLSGYNWTPIRVWDSENSKPLRINGNGHTISNMSVASGSKAGFFGEVARDITIENLTFDKANVVTTGSFTGVVIGYQYGDVVLDGVKVTNSNVKSTATAGIRIGGLVGFSLIHDGATIKVIDCAVEGTTITGYHNVAGLVGSLMDYDDLTGKWTLTGNKVSGNTITVTNTGANAIKYGSAFAVEGGSYPHDYAASNAYFADNTETNNKFMVYGLEYTGTNEYSISTAEQLFAFANAVNNGNHFEDKIVKLTSDIDLNNKAWTPIGQTGTPGQFYGEFDGNDKTIYNLYVDSSAQTGASYASGFFGWLEQSSPVVKNLTIDGATVIGHHNVAVIAGYAYGTFESCHVKNANLLNTHADGEACGDKTGLIVGYLGEDASINNCTGADSSIIVDGRDAGQIVGAAKTAQVTNCSATNVSVDFADDVTCNHDSITDPEKLGFVNEAVIGRILG